MKKNTRRKIKVLRSDNGGEYTSDPLLQLCRDEGIEKTLHNKRNTAINGVTERMNRTFQEKVCCILSNTGISKSFWAEALVYA